jgi:formylglycine-generating enzyme required for sulfatase activity
MISKNINPAGLPSLILILSFAFTAMLAFAQKKFMPGQTFRDCPTCPEMVVIPSGSFTMGAPDNEDRKFLEECPVRKVSIRRFAAGKFDITRGEWAAFVLATNRPTSGGCAWSFLPADTSIKPWALNPTASWSHVGFLQDDTHPVVCITWEDAQDYVKWLSKKTGSHYRLLTEAEWEYAARAGTTTAYPWGTTASHEYANYGSDSCCSALESGRDKWLYTSPVGAFPPNQFGLYDMQGNVLQYVEDCFANYNPDMPADGTAYTSNVELKMTGDYAMMNGTNSCYYKICRGGDFNDPPCMIRSAFRNMCPPPAGTGMPQDYKTAGLGFRVARSL